MRQVQTPKSRDLVEFLADRLGLPARQVAGYGVPLRAAGELSRTRGGYPMMKAIRIENATLISTTSGMPFAPVAASTSPFSSDMNPTTWLTAFRRVTMISRPSSSRPPA
jgi:hypothetical protein